MVARYVVVIPPPNQQNVVTWLVEYSAELLYRREVSRDGKTAYGCLKGALRKPYGNHVGTHRVPNYKVSPFGRNLMGTSRVPIGFS